MEEEQPQKPIEEVKKEPSVNEKKLLHRGALEKLPPDIRKELDDYIRFKNPSAARKLMITKYGKDYPILAGVTKPSWYAYAKKHNLKSGLDTELQTEIVSTPPELLVAIDKIADSSVSLTDKKAALTALYNDCAATSRRLESTQVNYLDPQIQMCILQNRKQMCVIVEKLSVLNDQLSRDSDKNWLEEAEMIVQVCTSAVVNSYKITHSDQSNFAKFISDYRTRLVDLMKSYRATKETLKKEPIKIG